MRVAVTGGAGYIGSVMSHMLASAGHDVLVIDNLSRGHREAAGILPLDVVDVEESGPLREALLGFGPDACMHFAAHSLVDESMRTPVKYLHGNVVGGLNLLEALDGSGCGLVVFSSSCAVYGIPEETPIPEGCPTEPINPYGSSKLLFEDVLEQFHRLGLLRYVSLRYFNAAGADLDYGLGEDHDPETHLIPRVVRAALGGESGAVIYGTDYPTRDGTCVRDYVHVTDLCRAHLLALEHLSNGGESETFNLGNGSGFTVREVIDSVRRVSGRDFPVVESGRRQGDPPVLVASSGRISDVLGWKPEHTELDEIVRTAWLWHQAHPYGYSVRP